jgi:hypothetical protein
MISVGSRIILRKPAEGTCMLNDGEQATPWVKSKRSQGASNCFEAAGLTDGGVAVRNSKDPDGPVTRFTAGEWRAMLAGAKAGEFDHLIS